MQYTYRNSGSRDTIVIVLGDYDFKLKVGSKEEVIAYANILSVRISKSGKVYKMHLYADDRAPIVISSLSFEDNKVIDQFREYSLLVRVLHHHLKDKSKAMFSCGGNSEKIWQWIGLCAGISFLLSVLSDYWGFALFNPYVQALALTATSAAIVFILNARNLPKTYSPTDIPLQFLP